MQLGILRVQFFFFLNKYGNQAPMSNMIPYLELANYTTKSNRVQDLSELDTAEFAILGTWLAELQFWDFYPLICNFWTFSHWSGFFPTDLKFMNFVYIDLIFFPALLMWQVMWHCWYCKMTWHCWRGQLTWHCWRATAWHVAREVGRLDPRVFLNFWRVRA